MKAKDTVMGNKKIQLLGQQYEDELPTYDLIHYLLLAQAEISFKLGYNQALKDIKLERDTAKRCRCYINATYGKAFSEGTSAVKTYKPCPVHGY